MVQPGQFLERPTLVASGAVILEALCTAGNALLPVSFLPPAPQGGMDHVLGAELAWALSREGHPTLRFNFRGVGASQGERGGAAAQLEDARAALSLLRENVGVETAVVFALPGSEEVALRLGKEVAGIAGVGLLHPKMPIAPRLEGLVIPLWVLVAEEGEVAGAVRAHGGTLALVSHSDAIFQRNLPEVGHRAATWVEAIARD